MTREIIYKLKRSQRFISAFVEIYLKHHTDSDQFPIVYLLMIGLNNAAMRRMAPFADYLNKIITIDFVRVDNVRHLMSDSR